jgi:iron complex outermembrane receptor protein
MHKYISRLQATRNGCNIRFTAALGALLAGLGFAHAETDSTEGILEPLTVTAFRFEQPKVEVPSNVTLIDRDAIIRSAATNLAEVLRDAANLHWSSIGGPASASLDARGFGASAMQNTLVIVDGRIVSRPDMGAFNWTQFPLETIESVEVLKGAHTSLYGDRASGSVIKITTRRGTGEPESAIQASYGSFQTENLRFSSSGRIDQLGYAIGGDYFYTDGYRDFSNQRNRSLSFGLDYALTDTLSAYGNFNFLRSDFNLPGGINQAQYFSNQKQRGSFLTTFEERFANIGGGIIAADTGYGMFRVDGGVIRRKLDNSNNFGGFAEPELNTYTLSPNWTIEHGDNTYLVGVDLVRDEIDISGDTGFNSYQGDLSRNRHAVFGQVTRHFTEDWIGNVSARHETARLKVDYVDSNPADSYSDNTRQSEQAFGFGLTHLINDNARAWIRFEHYYRYPATDEIAGYQGGNAFLATNFNSNLKPERGQTLELGGDLRQGNWLFSANPFVTRLKDEIFLDSAGSINSNFDQKTLRYGSDFSLRYDESQWGFAVHYRYIEAEENSGPAKGQGIAIVPKHLLNANVTVRPVDNASIRFGARYRGAYDSNNGGLGQQTTSPFGDLRRIGGATTFHLDARVEIRQGLEVFGSVDNLFDKRYTNFVETTFAAFGGDGYYPENGRSLSIGVRYRF